MTEENMYENYEYKYKVEMLYDFEGSAEDELKLTKGDIVKVIDVQEGWSFGVCEDGRAG